MPCLPSGVLIMHHEWDWIFRWPQWKTREWFIYFLIVGICHFPETLLRNTRNPKRERCGRNTNILKERKSLDASVSIQFSTQEVSKWRGQFIRIECSYVRGQFIRVSGSPWELILDKFSSQWHVIWGSLFWTHVILTPGACRREVLRGVWGRRSGGIRRIRGWIPNGYFWWQAWYLSITDPFKKKPEMH
mgnify:CR=1 FL=1